MSFVMRKSETNISDRHYLMDIPVGALVVAPEVFFKRFGKSFSIPTRDKIHEDLQKNLVFHAVPADKRRSEMTAFVVRRIHSSKINDALAGKLIGAILGERDKMADLLEKSGAKPADPAPAPEPEKVSVFQLTLSQLKELAAQHKIDTKKMTREQLQKAVLKALEETEK